MEMEILFSDENQDQTLELTPAVRSSLEAESSAILVRSLSEDQTMSNLWKKKLDLQLSLAPSNPLLPISNTCQENGNEIVMTSDFLEYLLQE